MSGKKYVILAVLGALIIAVGSYFLLNVYFEKVSIFAAAGHIEKGRKIKPEDLKLVEYYRGSLPEGYKTSQAEIVGRVAAVERWSGDPVTESSFSETESGKNKMDQLSKGEILIAINLSYFEPLVETVKAGNRICIVSTQKEEQGYPPYYLPYQDKYSQAAGEGYSSGDNAGTAQDSGIYQLSGNVIIVDGQIVIKNLEVIDIIEVESSNSGFLSSNDKSSTCLLLKCSMDEAPVISRITKEDDYKIFLEKL